MATSTISGQIQLRRDTASNWTTENPVLLAGELGLESDTGNAKFGDGTTAWNSLKYAFQRNNNRNIEYIVGTQTATTGAWKGVTQDTALYDGKLILYFLPQAGSGNATLELTFPNLTTTGAIPVYLGSSGINGTRMTTQLNVKTQGAPVLLAYDGTNNIWCAMQYWTDANTYDRNLLNDIRVYAGTNKIMNYSLVMQKADGKWESFTTTSGTATTKAKNTNGFRLGRIWVYNYNETINSGSLTRNDCLYDCIPLTLTYSTNCGTTLTARKPVYLVGTINSNDGLFYLADTWWTQTEPTTEDGKVYIYLGDAYSTSAIYKVAHNTAYWYKDGALRPYSHTPAHSHSYNDLSNKPTLATVATSGSYNDLSNKPTIPTVPSAMTASEASTGTSTTDRTITAKVLSDLIDARIAAITDGDGVSY